MIDWPDDHIPRTARPVAFFPALFFWKKLALPHRRRSFIK